MWIFLLVFHGKLYACLLLFLRYKNLLVKNLHFVAVLPSEVLFEALARGSTGT